MGLLNVTGLWSGAALSSTADFNAGVEGQVQVTARDREILRDLATQVAQCAAEPQQHEKRELWRRHNDLEATRPLVFCDPENGWNEIIPPEQILCSAELARRWEMVLRKELFWSRSLRDDKVIEPFFQIGYTHSEDDWGVRAVQHGGRGGAYVWEAALREEADVERLHAPRFSIDHRTTEATVALAGEVFSGLLEVRLQGVWWWSLGMTLDLALFRGLEQVMLDMLDRPQLVHRLMGILRDGYLEKLSYLEQQGLLGPNSDTYVGSGGFGYTAQLPPLQRYGAATLPQMWGFGESQETTGISPQMFEEFVFPYQLPLLERFGLNCYGCCEPLDRRWEVVRRTPNLRRVSVSPWADLPSMAEKLGNRYVFSWKPTPAALATSPIDEEAIRLGIRKALRIARGCHVEIIMKDNHTLGGNPGNAVRWVQIAREEAERA
jgi:hypothetical protein